MEWTSVDLNESILKTKKNLVTWKAALCRSRYMCRFEICAASIYESLDILRMFRPILIIADILFMQLHTFLNKVTCSNCDHIDILFITSSDWGVAENQDKGLLLSCDHVFHSALSIYITEYLRLRNPLRLWSWRHHSRTAVLTDFKSNWYLLWLPFCFISCDGTESPTGCWRMDMGFLQTTLLCFGCCTASRLSDDPCILLISIMLVHWSGVFPARSPYSCPAID